MKPFYLWLAKYGIQWAIARLNDYTNKEKERTALIHEAIKGRKQKEIIESLEHRIHRLEQFVILAKFFIVILVAALIGIIYIGMHA